MLGDVGQPQLVRVIRGEVAADEVVVRRRARLALLAVLGLAEGRLPAVVAADPPHRAITHLVADGPHLVGEEPVAELGIIPMGVEHGVGEMCLVELPIGDGVGQPPVVGLAGDLEPGTSP